MQNFLKKIGLSPKETDVFLILVKLGAQPVSVVAKHAGLPRSSLYFTIEALEKKKFVERFERKGITYAKAISIDTLEDIVTAKEVEISALKRSLEDDLPNLKQLESTLSITPTVKFFEGKEAVAQMYKAVMSREKTFCAIVDTAYVKKLSPELHYELPKILEQSAGTSKELVAQNEVGKEYKKLFASKHHQIELLPKDFILEADIIIAKDALYMVAYSENQMSAVQIVSKGLVDVHQRMFNELWSEYSKS